MNIRTLEIAESVEALKDRLQKETRGRQKQRLQALYLLKTGQVKSRREIARLLGVGKKAVGNWLERYQAEGLDGLLSIRTHTNRAYSLTQAQEKQLREKLSEPEGFPSYGAVHSWVNATFGLDLSYPTVYGIVRYRLGAKLKVARKSHTKKPASDG
jgi:transposase